MDCGQWFTNFIIHYNFVLCSLYSLPSTKYVLYLVVDFNVQVNMLYGTLTEFCTPTSCPRMTAGRRFEFRWADVGDPSKPRACSAPQYCDLLLTWIQVIRCQKTFNVLVIYKRYVTNISWNIYVCGIGIGLIVLIDPLFQLT